jgi:anti-sigma-K factor RskA
MTHEEARDLMPLFVVDADDRQTREALLAHLAGCEACREALQEFGLAADAVGQSVPQVRPRPELRARTLAAILGADHPQSATPAQFPSPQMRSREVPAAIAVPARTAWAPWLATAAALLAAVSIGGLWQTRGQLAEMRSTLALWQARVAEAERNAQTAQTTLVAYRRQLDVMSADDLLFVSLAGVPPAAAAQAKAFVSASENTIIFSARDLPALPATQVYQLWAIANGQPISAGTFVPDARGRFQLVADVPTLNTRPAALAVTVEPQGGVPAPTGPKYLLGAPAE